MGKFGRDFEAKDTQFQGIPVLNLDPNFEFWA